MAQRPATALLSRPRSRALPPKKAPKETVLTSCWNISNGLLGRGTQCWRCCAAARRRRQAPRGLRRKLPRLNRFQRAQRLSNLEPRSLRCRALRWTPPSTRAPSKGSSKKPHRQKACPRQLTILALQCLPVPLLRDGLPRRSQLRVNRRLPSTKSGRTARRQWASWSSPRPTRQRGHATGLSWPRSENTERLACSRHRSAAGPPSRRRPHLGVPMLIGSRLQD
mmetsp:Transcript_34991/g.76388  ORF Transcript_34991/g.76388 Transcript_34991/m.76388 type:complete len:223 (-) Transcript_34991:1215-1883(-)